MLVRNFLRVALTLLAFWGVAAFRTAPRTFSRVMHVVEVRPIDFDEQPTSHGGMYKQQSAAVLSKVSKLFAPAAAVLLSSAALSNFPQTIYAAEDATVAPPAPALGPPPTDFGLLYKDYYADCQLVVNHMRYAVQLEKGNPLLADLAQKTKDEMNDFVSYYRRFQGIAGKQSFSLLYTSINVLAGHYTSYGTKFPVPEKRKKRLMQEFNDIEKNIRKRR